MCCPRAAYVVQPGSWIANHSQSYVALDHHQLGLSAQLSAGDGAGAVGGTRGEDGAGGGYGGEGGRRGGGEGAGVAQIV
jgi:hypothetical protein